MQKARFFSKYKAFMKTGFLNVLAYKFNVFSWFLIAATSLICMFFLWEAVFRNSPTTEINGFTFQGLIAYTVIVNIFGFTMGGGDTHDSISDEIKKGQIAMSLIKPISYRLRFLFTTLGSLVATNLMIGIPFLLVASVLLGVNGFITFQEPVVFIRNLLLFFVAQFLAKMLFDVIDYIFGLITFYTMAAFGLAQIKSVVIDFLSGILIPIAFFPEWAEKVINCLPFVGMAQNPTLIFLGKMSVEEALYSILLQFVWWMALEIFAHFFFERAIKIVTIQGG